jgi:outer membrane immunogenic protein
MKTFFRSVLPNHRETTCNLNDRSYVLSPPPVQDFFYSLLQFRRKIVKKLSVLFLSVVGSASLAVSPACAETYLSGNLGIVFLNDADFHVAGESGEFSFDPGIALVGAIGQTFGEGMRAEVELGYRTNDVDKVKINGWGTAYYNGSADISTLSLMANGYYDFKPRSAFSPFIGGGVGFANVDGNGDDTVFAYQLMLGGSWTLDNRLFLDLQYRYFATTDPDLGRIEIEYNSHNLMVGLRKGF